MTENTKKKVLLLSYAFPPIAMPDAFLSAKSLGNLNDYSVDVICADGAANKLRIDTSLNSYTEKRFGKILRIKPSKIVKAIPRNVPVICQLPDYYVYLNASLLRCSKGMNLKQYDAIITWSQWHSVHLAGYRIKRRFPSLKWIAHFGDPWVDNPFLKIDYVTRFINTMLERKVLRQADSVIFTSEETADLVMSKYPGTWKNKVRVVPHTFDPELYPLKNTDASSGFFTFRYIGDFYGNRSPEPLFKALQIIHARSPHLLKNVTFELIGKIYPCSGLTTIPDSLPEGLVRIIEPVSYVESLKLMTTADVLLVIDAPAKKSIFLPSKLVDYLGTDRIILGIVPPGASADLINKTGGYVVDPLEIENIADVITTILHSHTSGMVTKSRANITSQFCMQQVSEEYNRIITHVLHE